MHVVIVGGGFGGLKTALELANIKNISVTVISDRTYFQYYPTLYSTATGYSHKDTWVPIAEIIDDADNIKIVQDTITKLDADKKVVISNSGQQYSYDKLVLALGSVTTYFGIEGLEEYSYGIKSEEEIRRLQRHLIQEIKDENTTSKHYAVIGAGPTGVELAAALGQYIERIHKHLNIPMSQKKVHIDLIEAAPRVLPRCSPASSKKALKRLRRLGINVEVDKKVESESADVLMVSGKPLKHHTVIWTSGVANAPFYKANADQFELNQRGHVVVNKYMEARQDVYVIGDNAATKYAGLAQTALHDGIFVAGNLKRATHGLKLRKYREVLPASVIPIGKNWAIFEWGKVQFSGWPAAFMREIADIIGYHDLLPLGQAIGKWRAGMQPQLQIPDIIAETPVKETVESKLD